MIAMDRTFLYTIALAFTSLSLTSCGSLFSVGMGVGGPVGAVGSVYDDSYGRYDDYGDSYYRLGYEEARRQALFLSDKMAYELRLSDAQYAAVYEINLDYLLNLQGGNSLYGSYWDQRNRDLYFVLSTNQYNYFTREDYFYRPVYWSNNNYYYRVYSRYGDRNYFYRTCPSEYYSYRGGRPSSYYQSQFGSRRDQAPMPSSTRVYQNPYPNGGSWNVPNSPRTDSQQGNRSFGNATRENMDMNNTTRSTQNDTYSRPNNQSFGNARREAPSPSYSPSQSTPVFPQQPSNENRASFGNARRMDSPSQPSFGSQSPSNTRSSSSSTGSVFGGHR